MFLISLSLIAELRRAKCAREAPWVRKNGNSSSRENLVMTPAYERASERASERQPRPQGLLLDDFQNGRSTGEDPGQRLTNTLVDWAIHTSTLIGLNRS